MASDPMLGLGPLVAGARRACAKAETLPDGANTPRVEMMTDSLRQLCDAIEYLIKRTTRRPDDELDRIVAWLNEGRPAHSGTMSAKAADAIDSLRAELAATRRMVDELSMRGTRANFDTARELYETTKELSACVARAEAAERRLQEAYDAGFYMDRTFGHAAPANVADGLVVFARLKAPEGAGGSDAG